MAETKYKQTEVGLIPEEWEVFSIGRDCSIKARIGWQGLTKSEFLPRGDYALITGTDIIGGKINWNTCVFVSEGRYLQDPNIIVKDKDVLVSKDGTIGKVAIATGMPYPTTLNSGVFVIRTKSEKVSQEGLGIVFFSPYFKNFIGRLTAGSTIVHLYQKDIVNFEFPLPPLTEQHAIASALTSIDNLIASLDKQIAKTNKVKHGAMQQLLTGLNTEDVMWKPLGEVVNFSDGFPFDSSSFRSSGKYAVIRISDLSNYNVVRGDKYIEYLPAKIKEAQILVGGEILIAMSGSTGKVGYNKGSNFVVNQRIAIIRSKDNVLRDYLKHILLNSKFEEYCFKQGTGIQNNIGKDVILDYLIPYPSMETQNRIASTLTAIDDQISALEAKRRKYEMVKVGMMQQLLTGRIRLK